jgi:hypothetical protein
MEAQLLKPFNQWTKLKNTIEFTELPSYAINKSLPEDTFFTNKSIAKKCFDILIETLNKNNVDIDDYNFIEPSAGEGSFYDLLPNNNRKALDINPKKDYIEKSNFLTWYPKNKSKYIVVGNPPFGVRGALALAFIKRSLLFADYVAFILPMSFYSNGKGSNMLRVKNGSLIYNEKLTKNAFYMSDTGENVSVNTVFQIWTKKNKEVKQIFNDYDVKQYVDIYTCCSAPARYCGLGRGRMYDGFIASTFYKDDLKIVEKFDDVKYGSGYGFIIKKNKTKILELLKNANWSDYCSDATNHCKHIRMYHIRKLLGDNGFGVET